MSATSATPDAHALRLALQQVEQDLRAYSSSPSIKKRKLTAGRGDAAIA